MAQVSMESINGRIGLVKKAGFAVAIVVGLLGGYVRFQAIQDAREMLSNGVAAEAVVVDKKHWVETGKKNREYDRYALVYEFNAETEGIQRGELRVEEDAFTSTNVGATLSVIYKAEDPSISDTKEHYATLASATKALKDIGFLVLIIIGATFVLAAAVRMKMQKQLAVQASQA